MSDAEVVDGENRLLDFLFFVRNGKIASQFPVRVFFLPLALNFVSKFKSDKNILLPVDKFLVPDCAYFCQPEGTHVNTCAGNQKFISHRSNSKTKFSIKQVVDLRSFGHDSEIFVFRSTSLLDEELAAVRANLSVINSLNN